VHFLSGDRLTDSKSTSAGTGAVRTWAGQLAAAAKKL